MRSRWKETCNSKTMEVTKWQYLRDEIGTLDELEERLSQRGRTGWELVSVVATPGTKTTPDENILAPEIWMLIFKQPAS
jgi:hypothetical protein